MASLSGWGCNSACGAILARPATWQKLISFEVLNPIFMLTENLQKQASLNERLPDMPWASSFCSHPFCKGLLKPLLQGNGDVSFPKGICWQVLKGLQ
jgi:hypothetical protein